MTSATEDARKKKSCFIITPIGELNSPIRKRVDQWMEFIYKPAFKEEFSIIRADQIAAPGIITKQILDLTINAELAVIDYTGLNPNVMYEAAIRHLAHKQFIQIGPENQRLPFDTRNLRTILYDADDLQYPSKLTEELKKSYMAMQAPDYKVPEILPTEFDFKKIVSDPEEFVKLLKKHLVYSYGEGIVTYKENISEVYEPSASSFEMLAERASCPKCGTLQKFYKSSMSTYTVTSSYIPSAWVKHYKCNVCGTEFV